MRETSLVLGLAQDIAIVAVLGSAIVAAFRIGKEDPRWEQRWRELSPVERQRLANAARSGALLADPAEIELAAGFARRERRRGFLSEVAVLTVAALGLALLLAGLISGHLIRVVFGCVCRARTFWSLRDQLRAGRNFRETIARDRGL